MTAPTPQQFVQGLSSVTADNLNTFVQTAYNVAQMRTVAGVLGMQIALEGTSVPGDGGQGTFYWNATSSATDDNGVTTVAPTGVTSGRWIRLPQVLQVAFEYLGETPPTASAVIGACVFGTVTIFPANFYGAQQSFGGIITNPTSTFVATINKNGTAVGTMTISTAGIFSFATTGGLSVTYNPGDVMTVVAPASADATASDMFWTFVGLA